MHSSREGKDGKDRENLLKKGEEDKISSQMPLSEDIRTVYIPLV